MFLSQMFLSQFVLVTNVYHTYFYHKFVHNFFPKCFYHTTLAPRHEHMEELGMKKYATEKYEKMQMKKYAYGTVCQCKKYANEKACKGINDIFPLTGGIWLLLVSTPRKVCNWKSMQLEKYATWKVCNLKSMQLEKYATGKVCDRINDIWKKVFDGWHIVSSGEDSWCRANDKLLTHIISHIMHCTWKYK